MWSQFMQPQRKPKFLTGLMSFSLEMNTQYEYHWPDLKLCKSVAKFSKLNLTDDILFLLSLLPLKGV